MHSISLMINILMNIKQRLPILQCKLSYDSSGTKDYLKHFYLVSKDLAQAIPLLEALVDSFMMCPISCLRIISWNWCIDIQWFPMVTQVSFNLLTIFQLKFQILAKKLMSGYCPQGKRPLIHTKPPVQMFKAISHQSLGHLILCENYPDQNGFHS